ncbi:STOM [Lepeophtheirus salmonis]|uniref:STOM n=2 Tax=Lepeophtheirus salmonis TaxID=72036 RepID=A0A7R8D041_LEPSM|nr:STOM [Lepeophtheirus salmonis]CAF2955885.1 STOM [Lepeophtheirus salmonis]
MKRMLFDQEIKEKHLMSVRQVKEHGRAVLFQLGGLKKGGGAVGPSRFFVIPGVVEIQVVDFRKISFLIPLQEILMKGSVTVAVDIVLYNKISNLIASVCNVSNIPLQCVLSAQPLFVPLMVQ